MVKAGWMGGVAALALMLASCGSDTGDTAANGEAPALTDADRSGDPLAAVMADEASLTKMDAAFEDTGLIGVLEGEASYTVFAPGDGAFAALEGDAAEVFDDPLRRALVAAILRDHMVPGALTPDAIRDAIESSGGPVSLASFGLGDMTLSLDGDTLVATAANGVSAQLGDGAVVASNGVVIPIDAVLIDPRALAGDSGGE